MHRTSFPISFKSTNKELVRYLQGILGILYDKEELKRLNLDVPQDYKDLIDPKYKGSYLVFQLQHREPQS